MPILTFEQYGIEFIVHECSRLYREQMNTLCYKSTISIDAVFVISQTGNDAGAPQKPK